MFKTYCSDHVYGFGQFFAIIATTNQESGVKAEIYLFAPETEPPIFDGVIEYIPDTIIEADAKIKGVATFVESETSMQLRNLAHKHQLEAYNKSKDKDIILKNPVVFHEVDNVILISLKQTPAMAESLRAIAKDTSSAPLREYIEFIFSWTIEIRPYKKGE